MPVNVLPYLDKFPTLDPSIFLAPGVCIFGDVRAGRNVSFWCNAVARGDVNTIRIGDETNIQDGSVLHVTEENPLTIGSQCTVGHMVMLHGCTIGDRCLIGMNSILLDRVVIGDECVVAAGSVVTERTVIPAGSLVMGSPAKVKRELTADERKLLTRGSQFYQMYATNYLKTPGWELLGKPTLER